MNAYRKPFAIDPLFPFEIVHKARKFPQRELPDHLHDLYELVYVHEGKGTFFIDKTFYDKEPGDLFVIPGNTIHRAFPEADDPIVSTAVFFAPSLAQTESLGGAYAPLSCFELAVKRKRHKIELPADIRKCLLEAMDEMERETRERKNGYRQAVQLLLQQLLLRLNRLTLAEAPADAVSSRIGPAWIRETLRSIDERPGQEAGLAELAERASVTAPHLSRVFKQLTGMNVTDYVNAKRIVRAKELLLSTEEGIDSVAERCGFQSLPHFHRTFKKLTGITPGSYRKNARG